MRKHRLILLGMVVLVVGWLGFRRTRAGGDSDKAAARSAARARAEEVLAAAARTKARQGRDPATALPAWRELGNRPRGTLRISGVVRDDDSDSPVPRAEVVFASAAGETAAQADDAGHYSVFIAPGSYRAFARADGYIAVGSEPPIRIPGPPEATDVGAPRGELAPLVALGDDQDHLDLHMRGAATISGTVFDGNGRPIAGAVVAGRLSDDYRAPTRTVVGSDMAETDINGQYSIVVPAGTVRLEASHADYAGLSNPYDAVRTLGAGEQARVDLTLDAGCIVSGTAVDADGNRVAEGALELFIGGEPPNDFTPVARLDAQGDFRLAITQTGQIRLRAWPWKSPPARPIELDCYAGARYANVRFVVPKANADLEGYIVTAAGKPAPGAFIDIFPLEAGGMAQQERADAQGNWAVYALPAGDYNVMAYVPGLGATTTQVTVPDRRVELRLGGTGSLSGRVQGIEYGSFTLHVDHCFYGGDDESSAVAVQVPATVLMVPVVDGEYRLDGLPACTLVGSAWAGQREAAVMVEVPAGDTGSLDLDLRGPELKTVYGVVTNDAGSPISGVLVRRMPASRLSEGAELTAQTDATGRYQIKVYGGDLLGFADLSNGGSAEAMVEFGDTEERLDIALE